jgi:hypothetical protein
MERDERLAKLDALANEGATRSASPDQAQAPLGLLAFQLARLTLPRWDIL